MEFLIVGDSGFLGSHLNSALAGRACAIGRKQIDLQRPIPDDFDRFLASQDFEWAIVCSAITDIEKCFAEPVHSQNVNVVGTVHVLECLKRRGIKPIFFSSDYVFKPTQSIYKEDDVRAPETCYGRQKLHVENYIQETFEEFLIFRTSKLMSRTGHSKSILFPVLQNLAGGIVSKCFSDQWLNPVFVEDIAKIIELSCKKSLSGVFHLGTKKIMSRYQIGLYLAEAFGCEKRLIQPISLRDVSFAEPRPSHNTLNCSKIEKTLDFKFTEITAASKSLWEIYNSFFENPATDLY